MRTDYDVYSVEIMFFKVIEIGVILWCLALPFECAAARFPATNCGDVDDRARECNERIGYRLPNNTKPETYDILLGTGISEGRFDYDGVMGIDILIVNATREVTLHSKNLTIKAIRLSNRNGTIDLLPWRTSDVTNFLVVPTKSVELLPGRRYRLDIKFGGLLRTNSRGFFRQLSIDSPTNQRWVAVTQMEPSDARAAFPCYDEPGLKINVTVQITHGANYSAVSNMPAKSRTQNSDGTVTTLFATSPPMSTYLIAFAVTDFRYRANAENSTIPMRVYATPDHYDKTKYALDQGEKALNALANYLEVPYHLPKMDMVFISKFPAAMENWGMNTFDDPTYLIDEHNTTLEQQMDVFTIIAHEFSHQWFGNIVTPIWWSYLWVKEGFAEFYQNIAIDAVYPEYKIFDKFVAYTIPMAFMFDSFPNMPAAVQHIEHPDDVDSMYGFLTYAKSACVIRTFMEALTEATFKKGLANYLNLKAYTGVHEDDLFAVLDQTAKEDGTLSPNLNLKDLMSSWSRQAGFPMLKVERNYENGSITLSQERYTSNVSLVLPNAWWIPYNFATAKSPSFNSTKADDWLPQHQRTKLIEPSSENSWGSTDWVLFNKKLTGYYRVMYDIRNWKLLIAELNSSPNNKIHPISRTQLLNDLADFVSSGRLPADMLIEMVKYLKHETEFAPWVAGSSALLHLKEAMASTAEYEGFRELVASIIESAERRIAVKAAQHESYSLRETRAILANLACQFSGGTCAKSTSGKMEIEKANNVGDALRKMNFRWKSARKFPAKYFF